jgi:hypothetical protein
MNWNKIVSLVSPYIVKIDTPSGSGTGFLCFYNENKSLCGIATAFHVVNYENEWQQPIRIIHYDSKHSQLFKEPDRFIFGEYKTDSAVIIIPKLDFPFPDEVLKLLPIEQPLNIGSEVGWLGFPSVDPYTLCFFSGNISARKEDRKGYLIDGVAINGVSGGPVVHKTPRREVPVVGIITAYQANRQRGDALPGLSVAQDVSYFHEVIQRIRSIDEAKKERPTIEDKIDKNQEKKE